MRNLKIFLYALAIIAITRLFGLLGLLVLIAGISAYQYLYKHSIGKDNDI